MTRQEKSGLQTKVEMTLFLSVVLLFLFLTGCEQPSNTNSTDNQTVPEIAKTSATPVTKDNIVGTWREISSGSSSNESIGEYTYTEEEIYYVYQDNTYINNNKKTSIAVNDPNTIWYDSYARKGTWSMDGTVITWHEQAHIHSSLSTFDPLSISSSSWSQIELINSEPICIIENKLFPGYFQREGTGTTLQDSWSSIHYEKSTLKETWNKAQMIISNDKFIMNTYQSLTESFGSALSTMTANYEITDTHTIRILDNGKTYSWNVLFAGDILAIGTGYSKINP